MTVTDRSSPFHERFRSLLTFLRLKFKRLNINDLKRTQKNVIKRSKTLMKRSGTDKNGQTR
jgi:hypothetical protein